MKFYTIDANHLCRPCFNLRDFAVWMKANQTTCRVDFFLCEAYTISTVFLGLDHNHSGVGDPLLFETMIFLPDKTIGAIARYCTWAEAVAGHERIDSMLAREHADAHALTIKTLRFMVASPDPLSDPYKK